MSYHSSFDYKFGDNPSKELIDELIFGLTENRDFYDKETGSDIFMGTYYISNDMDQLIYNIGIFLDRYSDKDIRKIDIEEYLKDSPGHVKKILSEVSQKLGFKIID